MQEKLSQSAIFFINRLKSALKIRTDIELAEFLGVNQSTISTWKARNSLNYELIFAKCNSIDFNWLIKGDFENLPGIKKLPRLKGKLSNKGVPYYESLPASAGDLTAFLDQTEPTSFIDLPQIRDCLAVLPVYGTSMKGIVEHGDLVAIQEITSWSEIDPMVPCLLITNDQRMIKYLIPEVDDKSYIWAESTNHVRIKISTENILKVYAIKCVIRFH